MIPPNTGFSAALLLAGLICFIGGLIILQTRRNALGSTPLHSAPLRCTALHFTAMHFHSFLLRFTSLH